MLKIAICIPTRGEIPACVVKWIIGFEAKSFDPLFIFVEGLPMPECRETLVDKFLETDADYLFFLDDDTIPMLDAIEKLLLMDKDIATGITWGKRADEINKPMIGYQNPINGAPQWDTNWVWPDIFQIDVCGLSCCLIKRKILESLDKPRFLWNWKYRHKDGGVTEVYQGEDIFFCIKAREAGFEVWCNSDVRCQHFDRQTKKDYPSEQLWERYYKKNIAGRVFVFDSKSRFNKQRAKEMIESAVQNNG